LPRCRNRAPKRPARTPVRVCRLAAAPPGSFGLERAAQRRLRRRQPRDRHAIGRARDVVETALVAEEGRGRIATMFATDAELQAVAHLATTLARDIDQLADALDVERGERVVLEDSALLVLLEERRRVIPAETVGGLGEVVGAEGKELGRL